MPATGVNADHHSRAQLATLVVSDEDARTGERDVDLLLAGLLGARAVVVVG